LYPNDPFGQQAWMKVHQKRLLDTGKIEKLVLSLRSARSTNTEVLEKIRIEADYFADSDEGNNVFRSKIDKDQSSLSRAFSC
jgi:hypothetical protein